MLCHGHGIAIRSTVGEGVAVQHSVGATRIDIDCGEMSACVKTGNCVREDACSVLGGSIYRTQIAIAPFVEDELASRYAHASRGEIGDSQERIANIVPGECLFVDGRSLGSVQVVLNRDQASRERCLSEDLEGIGIVP